jgi:hypothetical protein
MIGFVVPDSSYFKTQHHNNMNRIKLFLILDIIYKHKTVKSLIKKGMSMEEVTEETWLAADKGYVEETPTGFRLSPRGINQYLNLKMSYSEDVKIPERTQEAHSSEMEDAIPLLAVI